jgi:hypothetical protein
MLKNGVRRKKNKQRARLEHEKMLLELAINEQLYVQIKNQNRSDKFNNKYNNVAWKLEKARCKNCEPKRYIR